MARSMLARSAILRLPRKQRAPRFPRIEYPKAIENGYAESLVRDLRVLQLVTELHVLPELLTLPGVRTDAPFKVGPALEKAKLEAKRKSNVYSLAELFGVKVLDDSGNTWRRVAKQILAIDVFDTPRKQEMLLQFASNNVQLIETVHRRYFEDIAELAAKAVREGMHARQVTKLVEERFGVAKWNAERIARDQIGKLNSEATKANHETLGIRRYRWQTSGDGRVRDAHASVNGQVFSYDDPPAIGVNGEKVNPGEDILCRCVAIPIFEGFEDSIA